METDCRIGYVYFQRRKRARETVHGKATGHGLSKLPSPSRAAGVPSAEIPVPKARVRRWMSAWKPRERHVSRSGRWADGEGCICARVV